VLGNSILLVGFLPVLLLARTGTMDFQLLILKIEKKPAIWDSRDPTHFNRDLVNKHWPEIT